MPRYIIRIIKNELFAENLGTVFHCGKISAHFFFKLKSAVNPAEQTDNVNILRSAKFHAGNHGKPDALAYLHGRAAVAAGSMVGKRYYIKAFQFSHVDDIIRRHIGVAARRKA